MLERLAYLLAGIFALVALLFLSSGDVLAFAWFAVAVMWFAVGYTRRRPSRHG